jgi:hypothetical protein
MTRFEQAHGDEQPDLVDVFYDPLVRPPGNLVILFAQAQADLLDLIAEMIGGDEGTAQQILKSPTAKEQSVALLEKVGIQGFQLVELTQSVGTYWSDKERRNRYIHDDWYVALTEDSAIPATRGLPLKRGSDVVWDEPTPNEVWKLAHQFLEYKGLFSHAAYEIRRRKTDDASHDDDRQ